MSRWNSDSDLDYAEERRSQPDARLTETPPAASPYWWRREFQRVQELTELLRPRVDKDQA